MTLVHIYITRGKVEERGKKEREGTTITTGCLQEKVSSPPIKSNEMPQVSHQVLTQPETGIISKSAARWHDHHRILKWMTYKRLDKAPASSSAHANDKFINESWPRLRMGMRLQQGSKGPPWAWMESMCHFVYKVSGASVSLEVVSAHSAVRPN